jgi:hypothetical protein
MGFCSSSVSTALVPETQLRTMGEAVSGGKKFCSWQRRDVFVAAGF